MNIILVMALAGAAALMPRADEQPSQRVTIGARVFYPSGKAAGITQQRVTLGSGPSSWYVFTGKTLCEGLTISSEKPSVAGSGWRVDVRPSAQNAVQVTWERIWVGGKTVSGSGTKTLAGNSGSPAVLDSIDGGTRLQRQALIERLKSVSPTDLTAMSSIDGLEDGLTGQLKNQLADLEQRRRTMIDAERLAPMNTRVVAIDSSIATTRKQLLDALNERLAGRLNTLQSSSPTAPVDGCDALSMNLQVTAEPSMSLQPTETEIWLVHRDPAGIETVQRQVVRSASGNGSYVFDDLVVKTERGPITVEVYGNISVAPGMSTDGSPWLGLEVNRRYIATAAGATFGWKTKEGGTAFRQSIKADEVVAFNLLPLKDDDGIFVGHRFSVRVRTKILK